MKTKLSEEFLKHYAKRIINSESLTYCFLEAFYHFKPFNDDTTMEEWASSLQIKELERVLREGNQYQIHSKNFGIGEMAMIRLIENYIVDKNSEGKKNKK